jgi:hypothetical protein
MFFLSALASTVATTTSGRDAAVSQCNIYVESNSKLNAISTNIHMIILCIRFIQSRIVPCLAMIYDSLYLLKHHRSQSQQEQE